MEQDYNENEFVNGFEINDPQMKLILQKIRQLSEAEEKSKLDTLDRERITEDDITNLQIAFGTAKSFDDFLSAI